MTRRRFLTAAAIVCFAALLWVLWILRPTSINRLQFDAIGEGMTRAEVERLLGGPPRNECPDDVIVWVFRQGKRVSARYGPSDPATGILSESGDAEAVWMSDEGLVAARFGDDDRLTEKHFSTVHGPGGSRLQVAFRRAFGRRAKPVPVTTAAVPPAPAPAANEAAKATP